MTTSESPINHSAPRGTSLFRSTGLSSIGSYFADHPFANLVKELAYCEFKVRDQSTLLGFLWTLLYPLLMFFVLYELFVKWTGKFVESYPIYLMVGVVQWNFFSKGTTGGLTAIIQKPDLVTNFIFSRDAMVYSSVLTQLFIHLMELCMMLLFILLLGAVFSWKWIFLPYFVFLETVLITGIALLLSKLAVDYKDVIRIWEIVTFGGFFVTPIFFPLEILAPEKQLFLKLNPMMHILTETRKCLVYEQLPSFGVVAALTAFCAIAFWAGYRVFKAGEPHFAEKFP